MKPICPDLTLFDQMLSSRERILAHRHIRPTHRSDELYYELLLKYFQRLRRAKGEGNFVAAYGILLPNELLYAMDIVPLHIELGSSVLVADPFCASWGEWQPDFSHPPESLARKYLTEPHCRTMQERIIEEAVRGEMREAGYPRGAL